MLQVTGAVPVLSVDDSEQTTVFLPRERADFRCFTSPKALGTNLQVPQGDEMLELALPETLVHSFVRGKLVTAVAP
jgi:hypothetical protein